MTSAVAALNRCESTDVLGGEIQVRRTALALGLAIVLTAANVLSGGGFASAQTATSSIYAPDADYRIGALDRLNITVFQIKELTVEKMQVDASGQILLPLIGAVVARGKTTSELSAEIAGRLGGRFLQSPQVSVTVDEAVSQKVSVEGAVNEAGVFELKGRTSLLEAVARAKGAAKNANLHHVTIVRTVDGAPRAATFDLAAIGQGKARNPEVFGNDIVIVDDSKSKNVWHSMIEALPVLYVLTFL